MKLRKARVPGFRAQGLGFGVQGWRFWIRGFGDKGFGGRVWGLVVTDHGLGLGLWIVWG